MKIFVVGHPNARKPRIEADLWNTLHVYVNKPPLEGQANMAIIEALAKHFKVNRSKVLLLAGEKQKNKVFEIIK